MPARYFSAARCAIRGRFKCDAPQTHGPPDRLWEGQDDKGHRLLVEAWEHLHLKQARDSEGTVIRITRFGAADSQRDPCVSWFLWVGQAPAPLALVCSLYKRRYSHEHGYRGHSQDLLWDQPRLRTPEQFERWTRHGSCRAEPIGVGPSSGESGAPAMGKQHASGHASASPPGHDRNSCHLGHTRPRAQSSRKIAGLVQRQSQDPCPTLSGRQKT